jgi:hypothetical protein
MANSYYIPDNTRQIQFYRKYTPVVQKILFHFDIDQPNWNLDVLSQYILQMTTTIYPDSPVELYNDYVAYPRNPQTNGEIVMFIKNLCYDLSISIFDKPFIECVDTLDKYIYLDPDQDECS